MGRHIRSPSLGGDDAIRSCKLAVKRLWSGNGEYWSWWKGIKCTSFHFTWMTIAGTFVVARRILGRLSDACKCN